MQFKHWISQVGDAEVAELLGIKERTVVSWRRGERYPRPETARQIVAISKVKMESIYAERGTKRAA